MPPSKITAKESLSEDEAIALIKSAKSLPDPSSAFGVPFFIELMKIFKDVCLKAIIPDL